ncbi:MAG: Fe-S oxidoreductase [Desulfobacterales bacterium RIFOXYA12_FULL_46_15]|nr:MAG: Fe-S oxidoreductase [Desulfobacula sp. GWF2_41_7]OGR26104.1 MAG: Fe-S oxidoreductase [Desulfobacterales bacterium RIFOXYA12_FULL_46_15]
MSEDMKPVAPGTLMGFRCGSENECFNDCCRDLHQTLTPYDILRLRKNLGMTSQEFLKHYTSLHYGPESGLPVVCFKANPGTGHECPFVTADGCSVYKDRPASCRIYPLARAIARSRETGKVSEFFALIEEPHCKGFGVKTDLTVEEWLKGQDVQTHNEHNDALMDLISLKNRILPGKLEGAQADIFYLGLYDLDEFLSRVFNGNLLETVSVPKAILKKIRMDDEALLNFGIAWVTWMLFGIQPSFGD